MTIGARRPSLHRLAPRILAGITVALAAACSVVAGLDKLQFTACSEPCTPRLRACMQPTGCVVDGTCQPDFQPANTPCSTAYSDAGVCSDAGTCEQPCQANTDCPDTGPCAAQLCGATFTCVTRNLPDGPLPDAPLDCHTYTCMNGVTVATVADDASPAEPVCMQAVCAGGVLSVGPVPLGTTCGPDGSQLCSDAGRCGCQSDAGCTPPSSCGGGDPGVPGYCGCTKQTCLSLGQTCGSPPDGCDAGGTLSCDTGTRYGDETDVNCGGDAAACPTRCAQGKGCLVDSDCMAPPAVPAPLYCVDGVLLRHLVVRRQVRLLQRARARRLLRARRGRQDQPSDVRGPHRPWLPVHQRRRVQGGLGGVVYGQRELPQQQLRQPSSLPVTMGAADGDWRPPA